MCSKQHHQLLNCKKAILKYNAWLIFCSDKATTISEASCRAFHYEKFLVKIQLKRTLDDNQINTTYVETNPWRDAEEGLNFFDLVVT